MGRMHRRLILSALACWPAGCLLAAEPEARPRHKVSAGELHAALSARFPLRFSLGGLLQLQASAPQLLLLPARQRLGAVLEIQVSGAPLRALPAGELDLTFALRYERRDQTLRARDPELLDLRWPGMPPETTALLRSAWPAVARDAIGEIVLHRLTPRELALPQTMGFEPGTFEVVEDGLVIVFEPHAPR